jgi:hypothetical protein
MAKRRRTDNTKAKRKRTKGYAMIYKTLHRNLKIEQQEPHPTDDVSFTSDLIDMILSVQLAPTCSPAKLDTTGDSVSIFTKFSVKQKTYDCIGMSVL